MSKKEAGFEKLFNEFSRHKTWGTCWQDVLEVMLCALAREQQEDRYLEIISRYSKDEVYEIMHICRAIQRRYFDVVKTDGSWGDPLGEYWEEYSSMLGKKMSGQFFTPPDICQVLAEMTVPVQDRSPDKIKTVLDCAGGSGRTLIAVARLSPELNREVRATSVDIDKTVSMMCAINLFYHGVTARVVWGDSLSLKANGGYLVLPRIHMKRVEWVTAEKAQSWIALKQPDIRVKAEQLKLNFL